MSKLILVYNATSNLFITVTDLAHKMLSTSTYEAALPVVIVATNATIKQMIIKHK